jgi:hypothetical protein
MVEIIYQHLEPAIGGKIIWKKNFCVITANILLTADMDVQMKPVITVQSVLAYIAKQNRNRLKEDITNMDENQYPVYPEDDGYDTPKNPYSPV